MEKPKSSAFPYDVNQDNMNLNIREYFAIKCLPIVIKNIGLSHEFSYEDCAKKSVKLADALIAELKEKKSES